MMIVVRPVVIVSSAWVIACSEMLSSAAVGSSKMMILGFLRNRRAIARRCFSHHESLIPLSHTMVSSHRSRLVTIVSNLASVHACISCSFVISVTPPRPPPPEEREIQYSRFSRMVPSKIAGSCVRYQI